MSHLGAQYPTSGVRIGPRGSSAPCRAPAGDIQDHTSGAIAGRTLFNFNTSGHRCRSHRAPAGAVCHIRISGNRADVKITLVVDFTAVKRT